MYIFVTARNWIKLGLKLSELERGFVALVTRNWIKLGLKHQHPNIIPHHDPPRNWIKLGLKPIPGDQKEHCKALAIGLSWD